MRGAAWGHVTKGMHSVDKVRMLLFEHLQNNRYNWTTRVYYNLLQH